MQLQELISRINAKILPYAKTAISQGYTFRNDANRPNWLIWDGNAKRGKVRGIMPIPSQEIANLFDVREFQRSKIEGFNVTIAERRVMQFLFPVMSARIDDAGFEDHPFNVALKRTLPFIDMWIHDKPDDIRTGQIDGIIDIDLNIGFTYQRNVPD